MAGLRSARILDAAGMSGRLADALCSATVVGVDLDSGS